MHYPYFCRPPQDPSHKLHQPFLIRMGRVATDAGNADANIDALTIQIHIAGFRPIGLDGMRRRAFRLVADEQHIVRLSRSMAFR